jgi:hypothetical protein
LRKFDAPANLLDPFAGSATTLLRQKHWESRHSELEILGLSSGLRKVKIPGIRPVSLDDLIRRQFWVLS